MEQVAAEGDPEQDREMFRSNPPSGDIVNVYQAVCPAVKVIDDGSFEMEKSSMLKGTPVDDRFSGSGLTTVTWVVPPLQYCWLERML